MAHPLPDDEAWIELLLRRGHELRRAGILSIGCGGNSAVLAPVEPGAELDAGGDAPTATVADDEPANPWENPANYPNGHAPSYGDIEPAEKLPDIPSFGDG